ncbi:hypothetical protein LWI28_002250 [Acer negundo]|uniref:Uncharacterized protein n=1 Tax=Acer negundo TaxID=4023 RepID=A0AAD5J830_ACENE|nr:hypothetical protein LWI28_002250 [Acer negundo]
MDDETFKKELNKMFSEIHEILKPKRWSSPNLEPTPIKVNSGSDLVSHMLNLSELERGEPEHEPRPLEEEIKLPDLTIVIGLSQLHEASVEASIDTKVNSQQEIPKPWSDKPPRHIENKLRTSSEETRKLTYGEDETLNGGKVSLDSNRQQKRSVGQIRVFSLTDHAMQWNHHRIRITLTSATTAATLPMPFPNEYRLRLSPEIQLFIFSIDN